VFDEDVVEQVFYRKETTVFDEDVVEQVFYRKETTVFYRIETTVFEYDLGGIMTLGYFTKQNSETFFISADFTDVLETGETITVGSSSAVAEDSTGTVATSDVIEAGSLAVSGSQLKVKVKAGTEALSPYKITFKAVTSLNNIWEKDVEMGIREY